MSHRVPLRVVLFLPSLVTGGMEQMVHLLSTNLDRSGFSPEVELFDGTGPFADRIAASGTPVRLDQRGPGFLDFALLRRIARRWKANPPDVVHAHNSTALVYAAFAARWAGGIPVVFTEHGRSVVSPIHDRALHAIAVRLVERVTVVAEWLKAWLVRNEAFPSSIIDLVPNGIDGARYRAPIEVEVVRRELGITGRSPIAVCVARLSKVKNHRGLLEAWRRVADRSPRAMLLLAGDGPERAELEARTDELSLRDYVRFLGDRDDVPRLLRVSDFHVLPSDSEGTSLTLLEAMASGRPSIATAVGGTPEVIAPGRTGMLVPPKDPAALASAILELACAPARAHAMGIAAACEFERRFTLEVMVRRYERIYRDCAAGRTSAMRVSTGA